MTLRAISFGQANPVTTTQVGWGLVSLSAGSTAGTWINNTRVMHIDFSMADPAAVVKLSVGRGGFSAQPTPPTAYLGTAGGVEQLFKANQPATVPDSGFSLFTATPPLGLLFGEYFVRNGVFQLRFDEPIESLTGSAPVTFGFAVQRVDAGTASVDYRVNVWFDEY